jgi:type I restriction enzyme R subunit
MLADWFNEPPEDGVAKAEKFEKAVKKKFIDEPGQMKLLIVVDKLLTGFDAPEATYLYIDKKMRDHGLFQAICRVNRLDGDDKEYGYIVDYKDLFNSLEDAITDYTSGALDGYEEHPAVPAVLLRDGARQRRAAQGQRTQAGRALQGSRRSDAGLRQPRQRDDRSGLQRGRGGGHQGRSPTTSMSGPR